MGLSRYWRLSGLQSPGDTLALSALSLSDGATDYPTATLSGALLPSFRIGWDLGAAVNITTVKLTAASASGFPSVFLLEESADGLSWGPFWLAEVVQYPGDGLEAVATFPATGTTPPVVSGHAAAQTQALADPGAAPAPGSAYPLVPQALAVTSREAPSMGRHRIVGTVKEQAAPANTPLARRVLLIDEGTRETLREVWSDAATGAYTFDHVSAARRYTVVSYDHTGLYQAVIADNLAPEPMP